MSDFSISGLLKGAGLEEVLKSAQQEFKQVTAQGESGAGMVKATVDAQHRLLSLEFSDEFVNDLAEDLQKVPSNKDDIKSVLIELVMAAVNQANDRVAEATKHRLSSTASKIFANKMTDTPDSK